MNNRNDICMSKEEVDDYLKKMVKNALKHGITLQVCIGAAPMAGLRFKKILHDNLRNFDDCVRLKEDVDATAFVLQQAKDETEKVKRSLEAIHKVMELDRKGKQ